MFEGSVFFKTLIEVLGIQATSILECKVATLLLRFHSAGLDQTNKTLVGMDMDVINGEKMKLWFYLDLTNLMSDKAGQRS